MQAESETDAVRPGTSELFRGGRRVDKMLEQE